MPVLSAPNIKLPTPFAPHASSLTAASICRSSLANTLGSDVTSFAIEPDEGRASSVGQGILEGDAATGSAKELAHDLQLVNH